MLLVEYSQKQIFYCSLKLISLVFLLLIIYIGLASYFTLPLPSFFLLIPLIIGLILIPFQALVFDWFQAQGKSLSFNENEVIYKYRPNMLYSDTDEIEKHPLNDIVGMKVYFQNLSCLQGIKIEFKNNKQFYILGFFIKPEDFKRIKEHLKII